MNKKKVPSFEQIVLEDIIETIENNNFTDETKYDLIVKSVEIYKNVINEERM